MTKTNLTKRYNSLFEILDPKDPKSWQSFFGQFQWTIADLIFGSSKEFHELATQDNGLDMHPCIRLLGYYKATQEEPENLKYLKQFLYTLLMYYTPEAEHSGLATEIEERINRLEKK